MIQTRHLYANAAISDDEKGLQDIHLVSKNIAIYHRNIGPLRKELSQMVEQSIECRAGGTVEEILSKLDDYLNHDLSGYPSLFEDISSVVKLFKKITKASSFRLLLATVSTNMCRKFHTDINDLRLLCTYVGPGTIWLPDEMVNERALKKRGGEEEIVLDKQHIQQVSTGDVVLLKGALYEDANPILHRSPTIEEKGEKRLLLRIDTNEMSNLFA